MFGMRYKSCWWTLLRTVFVLSGAIEYIKSGPVQWLPAFCQHGRLFLWTEKWCSNAAGFLLWISAAAAAAAADSSNPVQWTPTTAAATAEDKSSDTPSQSVSTSGQFCQPAIFTIHKGKDSKQVTDLKYWFIFSVTRRSRSDVSHSLSHSLTKR